MFFTYQYNPNYLMTYITLGWLILVCSYSDLWAKYVSPLIHNVFFRDDLRHPLIFVNHQVRTYNEIS